MEPTVGMWAPFFDYFVYEMARFCITIGKRILL